MSGIFLAKHGISKFQFCMLCSLSAGHTMLPYIVFSCLATSSQNKVNFFVPIVVVYTVQRACIISLRGFGEIRNPYLIMKYGLSIALIGAFLLIFYKLAEPLLMIGALLVAVGLSPYSAMFSPLSGHLLETFPSLSKGRSIGKIIYLALAVLICILAKIGFPFIAIILCAYFLYIFITLCSFNGEAYYSDRHAFDTSKQEPVFFLYGVLTFLCLLVLRQYKQSGVSFLVWLAPLIAILSIAVEAVRIGKRYPDFVYKTYWTGAMNNYLILFNILHLSSVISRSLIYFVYLAISIGVFIRPIVIRLIGRIIPAASNNYCMILAALSSFLFLIPVPVVNFIGIILCSAFAGIVESDSKNDYLKDERHIPEERALTSQRIFTAGSVLNQVILLFTLFLLEKFNADQSLLYAYSSGIPDEKIGFLIKIAGLICSTILMISAVIISKYSKECRHGN